MLNGKKYLTINTDASFCPHGKVGGYAFYIICDSFKITKSGAFKKKLQNPSDAELKCIINALHTVDVQRLPKVDVVIINTDSMNCITGIENANTGKLYGKAKVLINNIKTKTGAKEVKMKHVRAHTNKNNARSWVNEWCDQQAKVWMKRERRRLKIKVR